MNFFDINVFAILGAALLSTIINVIWYSPKIFGKLWRRHTKIGEEFLETKNYLLGFILSLVTTYVLAVIIDATNSGTIVGGALVGFIAGIGFIAPIIGFDYFLEKRPLELYLLNAGHHLLSLILMGALLGGLS